MCNVSQKWARRLCTLLLALGIPFLLTIPRPAAAQSLIWGDIAGSVTDPSGAAIQGATVTATNTGTGLVKTIQTGGAGDYKIGLLVSVPNALENALSVFLIALKREAIAIGS